MLLTVFDFPGISDLQGCVCDLHPGGVGITGPGPEDPVLEGDAGDLPAPALIG